MSAYFDEMVDGVRQAADRDSDDVTFLRRVRDAEEPAQKEIPLLTGDREFPEDLRERILTAIARKSLRLKHDGAGYFKPALDRVLALRKSVLLDELHSLFHEVAERRIQTRFGLLTDNPRADLAVRRAHDSR